MPTLVNRLLPSCALLIAVVACSGANSEGIGSEPLPNDPKDASADTGTSSDGSVTDAADPTDAGDAKVDAPPATCAPLTNDGPVLKTIQMVAAAPPAPTGGTIPQGKFHLQEVTLYTGANGPSSTIPITLQGTEMVKGNVIEQVLDGEANQKSLNERASMTFVTSGTSLTLSRTCPTLGSTKATFSATATTMLLFLPNDAKQTAVYRYGP